MNTAMTRQEIEEKIIARAWQDESFKEELLRSPQTAFEKEGINLPSTIDINIVEETPTTLYFVLPVKPDLTEELSDAELDAVAGGWHLKAHVDIATGADAA
jgi:hypothetical protein